MTCRKKQQSLLEQSIFPTKDSAQCALDFVSTGIGCFALTLIESAGIVSSLIEHGYFDEKQLLNQKEFKNLPAIKSALLALCLSKVLVKNNKRYYFTELGNQLAGHIGLVTMVFNGYAKLMANGIPISQGKVKKPEKYLNGSAIALSSIQFGEKVDPIVAETIKRLRLKGTICDLGCGSANRLLNLCKMTSLPGLGLDSNNEAIRIAKERTTNYPAISIEKADGANLEGVWEDVQILMQSFMTHDIFPDEKFISSLNGYLKNFPNLKYFLVIDIVAPEDNLASHMPAYDYVHGLLGIETRQHDRFTSLFIKSGYKISQEIAIDMPNTYLWVLQPI